MGIFMGYVSFREGKWVFCCGGLAKGTFSFIGGKKTHLFTPSPKNGSEKKLRLQTVGGNMFCISSYQKVGGKKKYPESCYALENYHVEQEKTEVRKMMMLRISIWWLFFAEPWGVFSHRHPSSLQANWTCSTRGLPWWKGKITGSLLYIYIYVDIYYAYRCTYMCISIFRHIYIYTT